MPDKHFTDEIDTYVVLILGLDEFKSSRKELPLGFTFLKPENYASVRAQERKVLRTLFDDWDIPYCHKLAGWKADSPVFVMQGNRLAGGAYLYVENEFDADSSRGQVHYAFMDPAFQGQGLYSLIFRELVERARSWGLRELYLNSDRYLLPEVYLRWGARPWKTIVKSSRLPQNGLGNWLGGGYRLARTVRRSVQQWRLRIFMPCE